MVLLGMGFLLLLYFFKLYVLSLLGLYYGD